MSWQKKAVDAIKNAKEKIIEIDLETKEIKYFKIVDHRDIKVITGNEEIARAYIINKLVNELDYRPELIEIEKEYPHAGRPIKKPRVDIIVRDRKGDVFFFVEVKAPEEFEKDKDIIEGQLFQLSKLESVNVSYLVYITIEEQAGQIIENAIIIDRDKYKEYSDWSKDGRLSISSELSAGYGKPRKPPLKKGDKKYDLRKNFTHEEIKSLAINLHNVLWGGGGTTDSEVFNSLVNIILAKIQDEDERLVNEEYQFQVYRYEDKIGNIEIEKPEKLFDRINELYRRALETKLYITDKTKLNKTYVVNEEKFPLNKLIYTVQEIESLSFLEGRSAIDNTDLLGDFFEQITRDGFKQTKGQFFTPVNIVRFILYAIELDNLAMYRLNNYFDLPFIMDPSCGSGTFLIEAMKMITKEIKYKRNNELKSSKQVERSFNRFFTPDEDENRWAREYIYGIDQNFDLGTAAKVNMILHGDGSANLFVQDGLMPFKKYIKMAGGTNMLIVQEPEILYGNKNINEQFDVVISNPPFSVELETETKRDLERNFVFYKKKNSENLFLERYYQLLKENGRLGVVLPESVFDTTENKYIRIFLFKYFKIKAVVSLPQLTFEPFTSTKTSLLFAQKKTSEELEKWNKLWDKYVKEWNSLKTKIENYQKVFLNKEKIEKYPSIKNDNDSSIKQYIKKMLKHYYDERDSELEVKGLLLKYNEELNEAISIDSDLIELFGRCNVWWVFGEITKEINYKIFTAEIDNVGYKRSKRGPRPMPNDLFDIEYAPRRLNSKMVIEKIDGIIKQKNDEIKDAEKQLSNKIKKKNDNNNETDQMIIKIQTKIEKNKIELEEIIKNRNMIDEAIDKFYEKDLLKEKYLDRVDDELVNLFSNKLLVEHKSEDILLRKNIAIKILDKIRQTVKWEY